MNSNNINIPHPLHSTVAHFGSAHLSNWHQTPVHSTHLPDSIPPPRDRGPDQISGIVFQNPAPPGMGTRQSSGMDSGVGGSRDLNFLSNNQTLGGEGGGSTSRDQRHGLPFTSSSNLSLTGVSRSSATTSTSTTSNVGISGSRHVPGSPIPPPVAMHLSTWKPDHLKQLSNLSTIQECKSPLVNKVESSNDTFVQMEAADCVMGEESDSGLIASPFPLSPPPPSSDEHPQTRNNTHFCFSSSYPPLSESHKKSPFHHHHHHHQIQTSVLLSRARLRTDPLPNVHFSSPHAQPPPSSSSQSPLHPEQSPYQSSSLNRAVSSSGGGEAWEASTHTTPHRYSSSMKGCGLKEEDASAIFTDDLLKRKEVIKARLQFKSNHWGEYLNGGEGEGVEFHLLGSK